MLFCLWTAAAFCELSLKIIFPQCTVGICHFPSSQLGQSKSKLQFENHGGNSVIVLTCSLLNLIRQVRWPYRDRDFSASGAASCRTDAGRMGESGQRCRGQAGASRAFEMSGHMRSWGKQGQKSSWAPCSYSEPGFFSVFVIVLITSLKCELAPKIGPGAERSIEGSAISGFF